MKTLIITIAMLLAPVVYGERGRDVFGGNGTIDTAERMQEYYENQRQQNYQREMLETQQRQLRELERQNQRNNNNPFGGGGFGEWGD